MYDYDDIDRALFSLQLEEPPEDLRASILAVTAKAPREAIFSRPFSLLDLGVAVLFLGAAVWFSLGVLYGHGWPSLEASTRTLAGQLTNPAVLAWLGAGASTAVWLSLANVTSSLAGVRQSRA